MARGSAELKYQCHGARAVLGALVEDRVEPEHLALGVERTAPEHGVDGDGERERHEGSAEPEPEELWEADA